jgi:geranylgeranyl reductase family protein
VTLSRYDVAVVGSGPGGSVAALVLARGGARVALVDKAAFPRDKACGDIVGPRGLQVLRDLGVSVPPGRDVGDILVVGPTGRRVRLPCGEGLTYPGHGTAVTRRDLDSLLHDKAVEAGATPIRDRVAEPLWHEGRLDGYRLGGGEELRADFVIGADGATSNVGRSTGLTDERRVLWGFAVRTYVSCRVDLPSIIFWESSPWRGFPGYGWVFPGADGGANVGLGVATLSDRTLGAEAARLFPKFLDHVARLGLVGDPSRSTTGRQLGGWLKMGMIGTTPAAGRALLVGDAAGLVNPLQGEGIAQAMGSGRLAAEAILSKAGDAAGLYRTRLAAEHLPYHRVAAAIQRASVGRPHAIAATARFLVTIGRIDLLAGGWSVFWNELLEGAPPNAHRAIARAITWAGRASTARTSTARWFETALPLDADRIPQAALAQEARAGVRLEAERSGVAPAATETPR